MPLKRYLLFDYDDYYPSGGWHDFRQSFDSVVEAEAYWLAHPEDHCSNPQLVDGLSGEVIEFSPQTTAYLWAHKDDRD
jgi:hypothetical protein